MKLLLAVACLMLAALLTWGLHVAVVAKVLGPGGIAMLLISYGLYFTAKVLNAKS